MIKDLIDFRGGYCTDVLNELMAENELFLAENCQWNNGLVKRNGISKYSTTDLSSFTGCKGGVRVYINSSWVTIYAMDDDSNVNFYYGAGTTVTPIDNDFDWTSGYDVEFAELNGCVIAVNGVDKPAIIYYDSGFVVKNLEEYDTRTRENSEWYAGQYTDSTETFDDDSTDAQDEGADDFQVCSDTNGDGCFVSCDLTFNKVVFKSCQQAAGSPASITYQYWNGSSWANLTLVSTPGWTDAEGDKTLEFNIPLDSSGELLWEPYDQSDEKYLSLKYVILISFGTAPSSAFSADSLKVYHTQYLTQIMENERPQFVLTHGSRIILAANNAINMSPFNSVTGWRAGEVDYFVDGGNKIISLLSYNDVLLIFKESTIFSLSGNSYENWVRSMPLSHVGTCAKRSPIVIGGYVFFVGVDGIYAWQGSEAVKISKHIQSDIDSYTLDNACGKAYKNEYLISFPSNSIVLTCDLDTIRVDEVGDRRISFYKFTSYKVNQFIYNNGYGDNEYLLGIVDQDSPYIAKCDYGDVDNIEEETAIDMKAQTKYLDFIGFQKKKYIGRMRIKLKEVSGEAGQAHSFTIYSDDGTVNTAVTLTATIGTGFYNTITMPPYSADGKNLSLLLRHNLATSAKLVGYSLEVKERSFSCL